MTVIDTTTYSPALRWSNGRKIDRTSSGRLWAAFANSSSELEFWYSDDDGATWTQNTSATISSVDGSSGFSFFIDVDDHAHVAYETSGNSAYRRMASIGTATSWSAQKLLDGSFNRQFDVVAFPDGASWIAAVAAANSASDTEVYIVTDVDTTPTIGQTLSFPNCSFPSIDFHHTGDGKTIASSNPHLYVAGYDGIQLNFKKFTHSGGTWSGGPTRTLDGVDTKTEVSLAYDGTRVVIAYSENVTDVLLAERNEADTITTLRTPTALSDGQVIALGVTYDDEEDVHLWAVGNTSKDVQRIVYDRSADSWDGTWTTVATGDRPQDALSVKRGYSDASIEALFLDGASSPYDVVYEALVLNAAPFAPTLDSPVGGATVNVDQATTFQWTFSDPDAGDSQSAYNFRYRAVGAGTWTETGQVASTSSQRTEPGGTFADGTTYEWQVLTYDAAGTVGPWSGIETFVGATVPAAPTIVAPANAATISTEDFTVEWSTPEQDAYELRRVADAAGSPDTGTVYSTTGVVESPSARSRTVTFDTNGRDEHVQIRVREAGLWSTFASHLVTVSYTVPAVPSLVLTGNPTDTSPNIDVDVTHPAPTGGEPTVTSHEVWRRVAADGGDGIRVASLVAPTATWTDHAVASGVVYEYRVRALGDNGTSVYSAWTL